MEASALHLSHKIQQTLADHLPFCAYKKPQENKVNFLLQQDKYLYKLTDFKQSGFVFVPFNDISEGILFPKEKTHSFTFPLPIGKPIINPQKTLNKHHQAKEKHLDLVSKTVSFLKNNHASKIVISRKECFNVPDFDSVNTFINLLKAYDNAMVYMWYHPKIGFWIGATPEVLLHIKNNRFTTMALAGTQKNNSDKGIHWQEKEKTEQKYVTDYIVKTLKQHNISHKTSKAYTINAGNIAHIRTDITGVLSPKTDLKSLIQQLHPTPAVCGIPKETAKDFILNNEAYHRKFYTGFLGELNLTSYKNRTKRNIENQAYQNILSETNLFVNLRCMEIIKTEVCLYIGGGITKDSTPEKEFIETVEKAKVLQNFII